MSRLTRQSGSARARQIARVQQRIDEKKAGPGFVLRCDSCECEIANKPLRINISPPDSPWKQLRFHDLVCLLDFLEEEEDLDGGGEVFSRPEWIDCMPGLSAS